MVFDYLKDIRDYLDIFDYVSINSRVIVDFDSINYFIDQDQEVHPYSTFFHIKFHLVSKEIPSGFETQIQFAKNKVIDKEMFIKHTKKIIDKIQLNNESLIKDKETYQKKLSDIVDVIDSNNELVKKLKDY